MKIVKSITGNLAGGRQIQWMLKAGRVRMAVGFVTCMAGVPKFFHVRKYFPSATGLEIHVGRVRVGVAFKRAVA